MQPMDQGIIKNLKCHYRSELMRKIANFDCPFSYGCFKKAVTLKEAVWCILHAWDNVTPTVLKRCWRNMLPATIFNEDESDTEFLGFHSSKDNGDVAEFVNYVKRLNAGPDQSENDLEEWIECKKNAPVSQTLTDSEIIDAVLGRELNESEDSDHSNGLIDEENKMTMAETILCCDSLINFMEGKSFTTEQEIMQMYRLKEKFEKERHSKSKQTTLTDLFKRAVTSSSPSLSADSVARNPDNK
jgi:hypothetical protein